MNTASQPRPESISWPQPIPNDDPNIRFARVTRDGAIFPKGAILTCNRAVQPRPGSVVVVDLADGVSFQRYSRGMVHNGVVTGAYTPMR